VAIDSGHGLAVVANRNDRTVSVIDLLSATTVRTILVGRGPVDVAIHASGIAFVTLAQENAVAVIDPALGTLIRKIAVGHHPSGIAVGGNIVGVANRGSRSLTILNAVNLTPISDLTVGRIPRDVAINPLTGVVACRAADAGTRTTTVAGARARGRWASRSTMASASISSSWPTRTATPCTSSSSPPRVPSTVSARWTSASGPRRSP